jgi:hypothetical protein
MRKLEFRPHDGDSTLDVFIDGKRVDNCFDTQFSLVMKKHFGAQVESFEIVEPTERMKACYKEYVESWSDADGELMSADYRRFCSGVTADVDWNKALAEKQGYYYFKKLDAAGFQSGFAARLSITRALLDIAPEKQELLKLLRLEEL